MKKQPNPRSLGSPTRSVITSISALLCILGLFLAQTVQAQSYAMSNLWTAAAGDPLHPYLNTDNNTRGLAYNPATDHVIIPSRSPAGSNAVYVLSSATGAILSTLAFDTNIIKGGNFVVNMVGVTSDGVIYVGNLTTDATNYTNPNSMGAFRLYRWANETAQPQLVYSGDPSNVNTNAANRRYGDSLALRGTGTGTQILLGSSGSMVALMRTTDGINFTATPIATDIANADAQRGLAWGAGDTFWVKQGTANLKNVTLNLTANTGTVTASIPLAAGIGGPLDIDLSRNLLAIVDTANSVATTTHKLRLFDISNPAAPVQVDSTKDFPIIAVNGNSVGVVSMRDGKLFALDTNNGILGYYLESGIFYPISISTGLANVTVWQGAQNWVYSVIASGTSPNYQWQFQGVNIEGANTSSLTIPTVELAQQGTYRVIVSNPAGSVTNSSVMTVQTGNASAQVESLWNLAPDSRPYLTKGYKEYGVAINPLTKNVIVLTRQNPTNMIAVLDIETGAHKHYIDYWSTLSLTSSGMNKVVVGDDGFIYIITLTTDASSSPFTVYGLTDDGPVPASTGIIYMGDPGNGLISSAVGWGTSVDVRGGGVDTEILLGAGKWQAPQGAKSVAILKWDGAHSILNSTLVTIPELPENVLRFGLAWGAANTFWVKAVGTLYLVEYDLASGTGIIKKTYPTTGNRSVPASVTSLSYEPTYGLLAGIQNGTPPTPVSVPIYDVRNIEAGPFWVDQELFTTYNADIEYSGSTDFGAGYLVALGVNNGLKAFKINAGFSGSLPVIVTQPVGGEYFVGASPTVRVVADSVSPITYQWYHNSQLLIDQTNSSLTLTNIQLTQAGEYFARVSNDGGYRDSQPATISTAVAYDTAQMTNIWTIAPGTRPYLNVGYFDYGMSFNPMNSNLLVASYVQTNTTLAIAVLDALTGVEKHTMNVNDVSGGNRWLHKIGVADDGVVYAANRTTAAGTDPLKVYRWENDEAATPSYVAFQGDPFPTMYPNKLVGWTMDVRGAGLNTEILFGTDATNVLSILKTTDGMNFTPTEILVAGAPVNFARLGICFGAGNTFWVKTWMGSLYLVQYDLAAGTGTILRTYTTAQFPATTTTVAYNDTLKFLGTAARDDQKNLQIYSVADLDAGPELLDQEVYPSLYPSIEANGALDFGGNTYFFGLTENNGIIAMQIDSAYVPPVAEFKILTVKPQGADLVITWEARSGKSYQVQSVESLGDTWQNLGSPVVAAGDTASYTNAVSGSKRFYQVIAQ